MRKDFTGLINLEVKATPGALAILEREQNSPRTALAVTRAMFSQNRELPDQTTTLIIEGGLLSVHFDPSRNLALIITACQAWRGIRPDPLPLRGSGENRF